MLQRLALAGTLAVWLSLSVQAQQAQGQRVMLVDDRGNACSSTNPCSGIGSGNLGASANAGGLSSVSRVVSATASTNATLAKATAGRLYKITGYNAAASVRWLKIYNKSTVPAPGTDVPYFQLPLPPGAFSFDGQDIGFYFGSGLGYALTTGAADNDNAAVAAGDVLNLNVWYQ